MLIQARSYGETFDAGHLSDSGVLTLLCSEPTTPVASCCTHEATGCALGDLLKGLHAEGVLADVAAALGVLDLVSYTPGFFTDAIAHPTTSPVN